MLVILRLLAISLLILAAFIHPSAVFPLIHRSDVQLSAAIILILVVLSDVTAGLVLALACMAIWIRVHDGRTDRESRKVVKRDGAIDVITVPYITPEDLKAAQSNVVNPSEYDKGIKGMKGVRGEASTASARPASRCQR